MWIPTQPRLPRARSTRALLLLAVGCIVAGPGVPSRAQEGGTSISGSVRILRKGGESSFDNFANAVVWLSGVTTPPSASPVSVNQLNKKFRPRVLPVVKGQVVHFMNQDRIEHNVFSTDPKKAFDLGRYPKGDYRAVAFDELGAYRVYCDIHKAMILDIVVVENRYFSVTDDEGVFSIEAVPAGGYRLNVWHIYGGADSQELRVDGEPLAIDPITVTSTKIVRQVKEHLNKAGRPYKKKKYGYGGR